MSFRVLIVEHEPVIAMDLEEAIQEAGYAVAGVSVTGAAAAKWLGRRRPDLVLIDEDLPGQPGALELLQQIGSDPKIAVLVLASCSSANVRGRFRGAPEAGRLVKPFSLHDLRSALRQSVAAAF